MYSYSPSTYRNRNSHRPEFIKNNFRSHQLRQDESVINILSSNTNISPRIQAKSKVSQKNDPLEKQAENVADAVIANDTNKIVSENYHQTNNVQKMCDDCEEELQRKPKDNSPLASISDPENESRSLGMGIPLPESSRHYLENRMAQDFSRVRVHTDQNAANAADSINAKAYTQGKHIVFNEGQYNPNSRSGRHLLAHELTHVVQQNSHHAPTESLHRLLGDGHDLTSTRFSGNRILEAVYDGARTLKSGNSGTTVRILQQALLDAGSSLPIFGVDGKFGAETRTAVETFQRASGLSGADIDGIVGKITMGWLDQRFSAGPTPAGTTPAETPGCPVIKTVTIDLVSLDGSTRDPVADLNMANSILNQGCVRFELRLGVSASSEQTNRWLSGDTDLQRIHSCSTAHQEEKDLLNDATTELGLSSRYVVFYVASMTPRLNGVNFSPDCSSGDRAPFNRHLYISNSANQRTLAHELAHVSITGLSDHTSHGGGANNLMIPNGPGSELTAAQRAQIFTNV